jgi:hypothetical protein
MIWPAIWMEKRTGVTHWIQFRPIVADMAYKSVEMLNLDSSVDRSLAFEMSHEYKR